MAEASRPGGAAGPGPAAEQLVKGSSLGRYLVLDMLGAGAMGVVYAAYDPDLDRKVALKLLKPEQGSDSAEIRAQRLLREAKAIARLSHPNVVSVHDVGIVEGRVFIAMEFLAGGPLKRWIGEKPRGWQETVKIFIEAGRGLAAAHAEGLVHRDFKPDNVLIDRDGRPKVVDFGLARNALSEQGQDGRQSDAVPSLSSASGELMTLTTSGAVVGTPAYMAPEQFLARPTDASTDQFSFCVALYEALYGERPFEGQSLMALAANVTSGQMRSAPREHNVPAWVRRILLKGLATEPSDRFPSMGALVDALARDPRVVRRRRITIAGVGLAVVGIIAVAGHLTISHRREIQRQVASHVGIANVSLEEARRRRSEAAALRERALAAFDGFRRDAGEELWSQSLSKARAADTALQSGTQHLIAAVTLSPERGLRDRLVDAIVEYITAPGRSAAEQQSAWQRLARYDDGSRAGRLQAPATVRLETVPSGIEARLERYDSNSFEVAEPVRAVGRTPLSLTLAAGSYRFTFQETDTHVGFHYPLLVAAGENFVASVPVPRREAVPKDFVYVPEGRFLFGSANEEMRAAFLETVPLHPIETGAFFISRYETTLGDWIAYLDTLAAREQDRRRPHGKGELGKGGFIELRREPSSGRWEVLMRLTNRLYRAVDGQQLRYDDRSQRSSQDWRRFPVAAVSAEDAIEYAAWLDLSGRVTGARLCTEHEWERAARGADAREFPHGNELAADDANFDLTYGRKNGAYGPDEVGVHRGSVSPFGIDDMVGNVWEMTRSMLDQGQFVGRGGSFYQYRLAQRSANRDPMGAITRDYTVGLRICASAPL